MRKLLFKIIYYAGWLLRGKAKSWYFVNVVWPATCIYIDRPDLRDAYQ